LVKVDAPLVYREMSGAEVIIDLIAELTFRASPLNIGNDVLILDGVAESVRKALRVHLSNESKRLARVRPFKILFQKTPRTTTVYNWPTW
jgi:hypothetical protein